MAFRFGDHGSLSRAGVIWRCPSCGNEVATPLEQGCPHCKAGADAIARRKVTTERMDVQKGMPVTEAAGAPLAAFLAWHETAKLSNTDEDADDNLLRAFLAGVTWAWTQEGLQAPMLKGDAPSPTTGGSLMALIDPTTHEPSALLDTRQHATIVAALAFYRDNTLAYGSVPGQLSAEEVTQLLEQLAPKEAEV